MRRRRPERARLYRSKEYRDLTARLAANVKWFRQRNGWTQEETAERLEIATRLLQGVESGTMNLTLVTIARLCAGFGVDAQDLFAPVAPSKSRR